MLKSPWYHHCMFTFVLHFALRFCCILGRRRPLFCRPCAQVPRPNHPRRRRRRRRRPWCVRALELCPLPWHRWHRSHRWRRRPRCGRRPCQSRCLARPLACLWYRMLKKAGREALFIKKYQKNQRCNDVNVSMTQAVEDH